MRRMTGAIILEVTYGYQVKDKDDQFIDMVNQAAANFMDGTGAGKYLVDTFHFCKFISNLLILLLLLREA